MKVTVAPWRSVTVNCSSMRTWTASPIDLPMMTREQPAAMPPTAIRVRTGRRERLRRIIRDGADRNRPSPIRSSRVSRYSAGASGRMASAGGRAATRRTASSTPAMAAPSATATAWTTRSARARPWARRGRLGC
ncbi:MAG: hypothetical protein ACJ759_01800 [Thermoanaerobaculia bacterium]